LSMEKADFSNIRFWGRMQHYVTLCSELLLYLRRYVVGGGCKFDISGSRWIVCLGIWFLCLVLGQNYFKHKKLMFSLPRPTVCLIFHPTKDMSGSCVMRFRKFSENCIMRYLVLPPSQELLTEITYSLRESPQIFRLMAQPLLWISLKRGLLSTDLEMIPPHTLFPNVNLKVSYFWLRPYPPNYPAYIYLLPSSSCHSKDLATRKVLFLCSQIDIPV